MPRQRSIKSPVESLKHALAAQKPQHDTPIGVVHPYWARKPLNIVTAIIESLSNEGGVVFDPFVGSGTVAYSALMSKRKVLASDLNPLSIFITKSILSLPSLNQKELEWIVEFFNRISGVYSQWFSYDEKMVERIRYQVRGDYKDGDFTLAPEEIVLKQKNKKGWAGREVKKVKEKFRFSYNKKYLNAPITFESIELQENSRIAIPNGAKLAHFFDEGNRAVINYIYAEIDKLEEKESIKDALYFILSSSIPLLRLSDKKATSQWPYWRPKNSLTSRNPKFVLEKRVDAFVQATRWTQKYFANAPTLAVKELTNERHKNGYSLFQSAAQDVIKKGVKKESVDLILTDPPYADQAPYLEYSELWNQIILQKAGKAEYSQEIVKTDAPRRKADDQAYIDRLCKAFQQCCQTLKQGGHFVFFYQDRNLNHWARIHKTLDEQGLSVVDVIALPKQRRSMKSVTSPGRTFDGDLLVVAQKGRKVGRTLSLKSEKKVSKKKPEVETFFERYASLIREGLVHGRIQDISSVSNDVYALLDKVI